MSSVALRSSDDTRARPAGRRPRGGLLPRGGLFWLRTTLGSAAIVLALALLAHQPPQEPAPRPVPAAILVAPPPAWQPLADAKPRYAVDAPALKGLAQGFEARRHANGGREDKLVYGVFEGDEPYLRLAVFRGPDEAGAPRSFFIDLARRAGEAGLGVIRTARPATVATKLGTLEAAEIVLADGLERPCQAFRLRSETGLSLHGWHCAAGGQAPDRAEVACLVDRLAVLPSADDAALNAVFAQAERRRGEGCPPRTSEIKRKSA